MNGIHLRFYTYENRKHDGLLIHDWLLEHARKAGIHGGSAFRAIAGYGRGGRLHEQRFFELAGEEPILVEFIVTIAEQEMLLSLLEAENLHLFYASVPCQFGNVGDAKNATLAQSGSDEAKQ